VDGWDVDLPTRLEANYVCNLAAKVAWTAVYIAVYGLRPIIIKPKPVGAVLRAARMLVDVALAWRGVVLARLALGRGARGGWVPLACSRSLTLRPIGLCSHSGCAAHTARPPPINGVLALSAQSATLRPLRSVAQRGVAARLEVEVQVGWGCSWWGGGRWVSLPWRAVLGEPGEATPRTRRAGAADLVNLAVVLGFDAAVLYLAGAKALAYLLLGTLLGGGLHPMAGHLIAEHYMFLTVRGRAAGPALPAGRCSAPWRGPWGRRWRQAAAAPGHEAAGRAAHQTRAAHALQGADGSARGCRGRRCAAPQDADGRAPGCRARRRARTTALS